MTAVTGLHRTTQPCTSTQFALSCTLTPPRLDSPSPSTTPRHRDRQSLGHLITARGNKLHIYQVVQHSPSSPTSTCSTSARLSLLRSHLISGTVTSLDRVRTLATKEDGADRIVVGFAHAKMSLLEWSPQAHDLVPVSLHTFEKLGMVVDSPPPLPLAVDPSSRLAALHLPTHTGGDGSLALLPFFTEALDWADLGLGLESSAHPATPSSSTSIPYAPSHLLPLASLLPSAAARSSTLSSAPHPGNANAFLPTASQPPIRNVTSMAFLPGFTEPTLALLYAPDWTWSGRLEHLAHNWLVSLVTLSSISSTTSSSAGGGGGDQGGTRAVVIATSPPLPYSCLSLTPCPSSLGGVLLTTANGLLHLDQSGRVVSCPTTAWLSRDYPPGRARPTGLDDASSAERGEALEGSRVEWIVGAGNEEADSGGGGAGGGEGEEEAKALLWATSGKVYELTFERTGQRIAGMNMVQVGDGSGLTGGAASVITRIGTGRERGGKKSEGYVFVGSEQGGGGLVKWSVGGSGGGGAAQVKVMDKVDVKEENGMDLEDDEGARAGLSLSLMHSPLISDSSTDIYGTSSAPTLPVPTAASTAVIVDDAKLKLEVCDTLSGFGTIRELGMGLVDDSGPAELVAATGAGKTAGLTVFYRTLPLHSSRPLSLPATAAPPNTDGEYSLPPFSATDGLWKLSLAPLPSGETGEVWVASGGEEGGTTLYRPSPSGLASTSASTSGLSLVSQLPQPTLSCGALSSSALVLVHSTSITVLDAALNPTQSIPFPHGPAHAVAHPPHATFSDDYVVVHIPTGKGARAKTAPQVFVFDEPSGGIVEVEGWEGKEGARAAVWRDEKGSLPLVRPEVAAAVAAGGVGGISNGDKKQMEVEEDEDDLYGGGGGDKMEEEDDKKPSERRDARQEESRVVLPEAGGREIAVEIDAVGELTLRVLPSLSPVFTCPRSTLLPSVLSDTPSPSPEDLPPLPSNLDLDDLRLDRVLLTSVGPIGREKPHLFILLSSGTLAVYEAFPSLSAVSPSSSQVSGEEPRLAVRWVKTLIRHLPSSPRRKGNDAPPARRDLVPFSSVSGHAGVFVTGEEALWILKGEHGPIFARESTTRGIHGFAEMGGRGNKEEVTLRGREGEEEGEFVVQTREGTTIARLPPYLSLSTPLASVTISKDRRYNHLVFDLTAGLYVASTVNETAFMAFDEEGVPLWKEEAPGLLAPHNYRSTLEVLVPGSWEAIHGYEFRQNEFVTALKSVSLASKSTASGKRDFVAVGTAVYRGEDLATRGGLYVFELVPVNPHPSTPTQNHQLRLLFFEDTKAVVNALCDLNGYLFLAMGQKLYARALEQDEFLLSVGFLDVGVHVTSLQAMKNFLCIGDAVQSLALVAFQEDPYKLVLLGRDYTPVYASNANFLINEGKVAFVSGDDKGVLRLFEYDPSNIASSAGQRLLCRTEYYSGSEATATMLFAKHLPGEDPKQNGILYGGLDGSLSSVVPVRDAVFKRLQSLQALMTRHVLHFGGLNPRGYRIVNNDTVSRALTKGMLDGDLLAQFEYLPIDRQTDLAEACGTDADTVRANLRGLRGWE
ncbi:hypothetical protein JCM11641_006446 [Rhodosporidiobolus odoratus]